MSNQNTSVNLDGIKEKIKKLLALSESPNEAEAASALKKAQAFMETYNLTPDDCVLSEETVTPLLKWGDWRQVVAGSVARLYGCFLLQSGRHGDFTFYGQEIDVAIAKEMFIYLQKAVIRSSAELRKNKTQKQAHDIRLGIAIRLRERIEENETTSAWKTVTQDKLKKAKAFAELSSGGFKTSNTRLNASGTAYNKGYKKGNDISLARQMNSNGEFVSQEALPLFRG